MVRRRPVGQHVQGDHSHRLVRDEPPLHRVRRWIIPTPLVGAKAMAVAVIMAVVAMVRVVVFCHETSCAAATAGTSKMVVVVRATPRQKNLAVPHGVVIRQTKREGESNGKETHTKVMSWNQPTLGAETMMVFFVINRPTDRPILFYCILFCSIPNRIVQLCVWMMIFSTVETEPTRLDVRCCWRIVMNRRVSYISIHPPPRYACLC